MYDLFHLFWGSKYVVAKMVMKMQIAQKSTV